MKKTALKYSILQMFCFISSCFSTTPKTFYNHINISHIEAGGIGYTDGYTSANLFFTPKIHPKGYCFIEGRAHVFDNGKFASNLGLGMRWKSKKNQAFYGVNLFYDTRQYYHLFHQMSGGFEFQKNRVFFNTNFYITIGLKNKKFNVIHYKYDADNYWIQNISKKLALVNHFDIEIGFYPLMHRYRKLYIGIGPYILNSLNMNSHHKKYWGRKIHLDLTLNQLFGLKILGSQDALFHTNIQGQLALTIPLFKQKKSSIIPFSSVIRQEIIPLQELNYWTWNY